MGTSIMHPHTRNHKMFKSMFADITKYKLLKPQATVHTHQVSKLRRSHKVVHITQYIENTRNHRLSLLLLLVLIVGLGGTSILLLVPIAGLSSDCMGFFLNLLHFPLCLWFGLGLRFCHRRFGCMCCSLVWSPSMLMGSGSLDPFFYLQSCMYK